MVHGRWGCTGQVAHNLWGEGLSGDPGQGGMGQVVHGIGEGQAMWLKVLGREVRARALIVWVGVPGGSSHDPPTAPP